MNGRLWFGMLLLGLGLLLAPPLATRCAAADPAGVTGVASVEERRLLAAIAEQREQLRQKAEKLQQRELELKTLAAEVDKKLEELRKAREEAAAVLDQKQQAQSKRMRSLSAMYEKMPPAKAAELLGTIEESLAVDILAGMKSKTAGRVLGNMPQDKAARLSKAYSKF